jgi:hypothetical protein
MKSLSNNCDGRTDYDVKEIWKALPKEAKDMVNNAVKNNVKLTEADLEKIGKMVPGSPEQYSKSPEQTKLPGSSSVYDSIGNAFSGATGAVTGAARGAAGAVSDAAGAVTGAARGAAGAVSSAVTGAANYVGNPTAETINTIKSGTIAAVTALTYAFARAFNGGQDVQL